MENLQSYLCLRCSDKDKWLCVYFATVLNCNVCILDSLFHVFWAVLALKRPYYSLGVMLCIRDILWSQLVARLGPIDRVHMNESAVWRSATAILELNAYHRPGSVWGNTIECIRVDKTFIRVEFSFEDDILKFCCGYKDSEKKPFKSGLLEWFVEACLEDTVKFYFL